MAPSLTAAAPSTTTSSSPLAPPVVELYTRVVAILRRGDTLKDDTYLAHLCDRTAALVSSPSHLHLLHLHPLLQEGLSSSSSLPHLRPFLLTLAAKLLTPLPSLATSLLHPLHLPDLRAHPWGEGEPEELCPTLHLLTRLAEVRGEKLEGVWHLLLLPSLLHSHLLRLYTRRALSSLLSSHLLASLRSSSPGVRRRAEEELEVLLEDGRLEEVAEMLLPAATAMEEEEQRSFLAPLLEQHLHLSTLLSPSAPSSPSPHLVRLFVTTFPTATVTSTLSSIFHSSSPLHLRKLCTRLAAEQPRLLPLLHTLLPQVLEEEQLLLHLLSLHTLSSVLPTLSSLPPLTSHLSSLLTEFSEEPSSSSRLVAAAATFLTAAMKHFSSVSSAASTFFTSLASPLLAIASLRLSVCEELRGTVLLLLASLLPSLPTSSLPSSLLPSLCTLSLESSSWGVRDSALSCLSSLLASPSLLPLLLPSLPLLLSSLRLSLTTSATSYVRAAALRTCTSLASTPASLHLPTSSLLALLPFAVTTPTSVELHVDPSTFFEEQEEVVRRDLVLFLTATYRRMLGQEKEKKDGKEKVEKELVEDFLVFVMAREQDWEVKVLAAAFWKLLVDEELVEEERVLVGLVLGCTDYEASVRAEFRRRGC